MVQELEMIQFLERVANLVEQGDGELAVAHIDNKVYDLCLQVEQFEMEMAPA